LGRFVEMFFLEITDFSSVDITSCCTESETEML
jgi:hypothetical protein